MKHKTQIVIALIFAMTSGAVLYRYYLNLSLHNRISEEFVNLFEENNAPDESKDLNLPSILIIGDSISKGYIPPLKIILDGKINVEQIDDNAKDTNYTLSNLSTWLKKKSRHDLILFNNGLHDLECVYQNGQLDDEAAGEFSVSLESYRENLNKIVKVLQKTEAKLLFATTTPIPDEAAGWIAGSEMDYNRAAMEIMESNGVEICDLHTIAVPYLPIIQRHTDIHFNPIGSWIMATGIAAVILNQK